MTGYRTSADHCVTIESWVDLGANTRMRYEINEHNDRATLIFGDREEFVLYLTQQNLAQLSAIAADAATELEARGIPSVPLR